MTKYEKINKINELKNLLNIELEKEVKDLILIKNLRDKIINIGLTLTANDFVK